ncbi:1503_t:CDS:2, partial [Cetraspora pellucida]
MLSHIYKSSEELKAHYGQCFDIERSSQLYVSQDQTTKVRILLLKFVDIKALSNTKLARKEVNEFRSVVGNDRFDFGVVVGVLKEKISDEAYISAEKSEHDIINLIASRLSQEFHALEDKHRFLEDRRRFLEDRLRLLENR